MKQTILTPVIKPILRWILLCFTVPFFAMTSAFAQTSWNGNIDSDWNKAGNWSAGVPDASDDVLIPAALNNPVISGGTAALAKSVLLQQGALTIQTSGSLTIHGSASYAVPFSFTAGLNNAGTVLNNGALVLGSLSGTGAYGIVNQGAFTNSGTIRIDDASDTALFNMSGTFTNEANIMIGSVKPVGYHGIWNDGIFQNNTGGEIQIDRFSLRGLVVNSNTFYTSGMVTIGAMDGAGTDGVENRASLVIEACGKLIVEKGNFVNQGSKTVSNAGFLNVKNSLSNSGSITNNGVLHYGSLTGAIVNNQVIVHNNPGPVFSYGSGFNWQVSGIFTDADGTQPAGIFTAPNNFVPGSAVTPGNNTLYAKITPAGGSCLFLVPFSYQAAAQLYTWTGSESSDWHNANNWSPGIPHIGSDVVIPMINAHNPVIQSGQTAAANSVLVKAQGSLTISAGASLTIHGSAAYTEPFTFDFTAALNNQGNLTNNGQLILGTTAITGKYGVVNQGILDNKSGAEIRIDYTTDTGIFNATGTFTNEAAIRIGAHADVGFHGIWNDAVFNNTAGSVQIDRSSIRALMNNADEVKSIHASFSNAAAITIGALASAGATGIENLAEFTNGAGGNIKIDRSSSIGLHHASGTFTNAASITIGAAEAAGQFGLASAGNFVNTASGEIQIDRVSRQGLAQNVGTFDNSGTIRIGSLGPAGVTGIVVSNIIGSNQTPAFHNYAGAAIHVDRTSEAAMAVYAHFTNAGEITLGAIENIGSYGINQGSTFHNNAGGHIRVDRAVKTGINAGGIFNNAARITIGGQDAVMGKDGITVPSGSFNNLKGGDIRIDRPPYIGMNVEGGTVNNAGDITIGATAGTGNWGIVAQGSLYNDGHIRIDGAGLYSIYVFKKGLFSNAAAITIGASAKAGTHGIYNWAVFRNNVGGDIRIDRSSDTGLLNFEGDFKNDGSITIGSVAHVGTYGLVNRGTFRNNAGAQLQIDRSSDTGLYNYSIPAFENAGKITIGANETVGVHGIFNETVFNNNEGGEIRIDRTSLAALRNFNGTFTNAATITIGAVASAGTYGIRNQSAFANHAGGEIRLDNVSEGVFAENSTFDNAGTLTIGGAAAVASLLTRQGTGSFSNSTDGILKGTGQLAAEGFTSNGGMVSPGYSPGKLTFDHDEDFSSGILDIQVDGTGTPGITFDQIVVNGTATLGGTLNVSVGYHWAQGDKVTILSAQGISGTFSTVTGLPSGWEIGYTADAVTLTAISPPLPVTLVTFHARAVVNTSELQWRTTSETDNQGFYIERSADAFSWSDIGFVEGKATTSQTHDYVFLDQHPAKGLNYYRLRQTDFDGKTQYSRIQGVKFEKNHPEVTVWVDADRRARIQTEDTIELVTLVDLSGRLWGISRQSGIDLSGVPAGMLLVRVQTRGGMVTRKIVLR